MRKEITFVVTFKGGAGEIRFTDIDGIPNGIILDCDGSNPTNEQSFTASQSTGPQNVIVGGVAPSEGSITVTVKDGDEIVVSAEFGPGPFVAQRIDYDV
jgi:hypothetical protein